jgi:hypothetical protein
MAGVSAIGLPSAISMVVLAIIASTIWDRISPDPIAVFSALVQTGVTTRVVLLCLFFVVAFVLYLFRTIKRTWYGYVEAVAGLAIGWEMIASLAIQIQAVSVVALVAGGYLLARGLVNIQEGRALTP